MDRLINDLLDVTRIDAGTLAIEKRKVDVRRLLEETIDLFAASAASAKVELECNVEDGVDSLLGDHERLRQVLSNLAGNALKFTSAGGRVSLSARRSEKAIERTGAGLGLAIVKGIVDAHGGHISIDSVVEKGTSVSFTIAVAD